MADRNCVNCVHWLWDSGHDRYSDVTAGESWSSQCVKGHWYMTGTGVSEKEYRTKHEQGAHVPGLSGAIGWLISC